MDEKDKLKSQNEKDDASEVKETVENVYDDIVQENLEDSIEGDRVEIAGQESVEDNSEPGDDEVVDAETTTSEHDSENTMRKYEQQIEELEKKMEDYEIKVKEYYDKWLRTLAEFDNFRKRMEKETSMSVEYALEGFVKELLPILDAFEKGLEAGGGGNEQSLLEGMKLLYKNLITLLEKYEIKQIDALGKDFDPFYHEAISKVPAEGGNENKVVEEFQKGYIYKDRVIRPTLVAVAVKEGESQTSNGDMVKDEGASEVKEEKESVSADVGSNGTVEIEVEDEKSLESDDDQEKDGESNVNINNGSE